MRFKHIQKISLNFYHPLRLTFDCSEFCCYLGNHPWQVEALNKTISLAEVESDQLQSTGKYGNRVVKKYKIVLEKATKMSQSSLNIHIFGDKQALRKFTFLSRKQLTANIICSTSILDVTVQLIRYDHCLKVLTKLVNTYMASNFQIFKSEFYFVLKSYFKVLTVLASKYQDQFTFKVPPR